MNWCYLPYAEFALLLHTVFILLLMWNSRIKSQRFLRVLSNTLLQINSSLLSTVTTWTPVGIQWMADKLMNDTRTNKRLILLQHVRLQLQITCCGRDYVFTESNLWAKLNWYNSVWRHLKKVSIVDTGICIGQFSQWT